MNRVTMNTMNIDHTLIGTHPSVEFLGKPGALDEVILRYEQSAPKVRPEFGLMDQSDITAYVKESLSDPQKLFRIADGVCIELAAQHFFGLVTKNFETMGDLIAAIRQQEHSRDFDLTRDRDTLWYDERMGIYSDERDRTPGYGVKK